MKALPGLETAALGRYWEHHAALSSTNDYCKEHAARLPHGAAVTASLQTAGRGGQGKRWVGRADQGLALSVLLADWPCDVTAVLPLVAGLGVAQGLEALSGAPCTLKWSNDVLVAGEKLCGILCESRISQDGGFAVMGIGVNLRQTQEDFLRLDLVYATSLFLATGRRYSPEETAAAILNQLEPLLFQCREQGFGGALRERYRQRCVTLGREVRLLSAGAEQRARALDIDADGALVCEIGGERRRVLTGEVSVRGVCGYG